MATRSAMQSMRDAQPVFVFWQFDSDGDIVPRLSVETDASRDAVFDAYGVSSVSELADTLSSGSRRRGETRVGVLVGEEPHEFHTDRELLSRVDGISQELADGLVSWCDDIPTICKRQREDGDVFLGDLLHDARVSDREWVPELEAFVDMLGVEDSLELRMKNASVWVEPDSVHAT